MGENVTGFEIAVIGMYGRFPGADNIEEFWNNLINGVESITFFSDEQFQESNIGAGLVKNTNSVNAGGILQNKDSFDASFFEYSPKEVEIMDPQVRVLHECVWSEIEDAG